MNKLIIAAATGTLAFTAAPALADHHGEAKAEVVETNAKGHATKVKIGEKTYEVCTSDAQDGCINPREAGLKWGNTPLNYWPGKPASKIEGSLPANK
ncbi:hypothetical protein [Altererythrobacter sp. MF3-039]|uniref:hypothetical protein n=1 Tax=Altererythrobacter sp. MF3-039 TaxID=3252901 RepID=UPI00390C8B64